MKRIIVITLFVNCLSMLNAQTNYFNKLFDYQGWNDLGANIVLTQDGGYLLSGETVTNVWRGLRFIKTDEFGDTVWTKLYKKDSIGYLCGYRLIETLDSNYALGGTIIDVKTDNWDALIVKVGKNGDTLWTKKYGGIYDEWINSIVQNSDGTFILAGGTNAISSGATNDILLMKTDSDGNILWQKNYGGIQNENALSLIQTPDNGYILVGYTNSYGAGSYDVYIVKVDSSGNKKWQKTYGYIDSDGGGGICRTNDGNYIIAGGSTTSSLSSQGYAIKIDTSGNKIWEKLYGHKGFDSFDVVPPKELQDNSIILGGIISDTVPPNSTYGWLMKTSTNGDSLWSRFFKVREAQHYFTDIKQTNDGGFIIGGYVFPDGTGYNTEDMWLVKVDSFGCDTAGCWITGIEEKVAEGSDSKQLKIYPNPFREYAFVKVNDMFAGGSELRIIDITGRIKKTYKIFYPKQTEIISASELGSGIFLAQYEKDGIVLSSQKIIVLK